MKEIIWIYGSSAAGKETFIKYILNKPHKELVKRINLENKNIQLLQESIDLIGEYNNDPKQELRLNIPEYTDKLIKKNQTLNQNQIQIQKIDTIIIKGQDYDLENNTPNKLKQKLKTQYPNLIHRIIFLHADFEILYNRIKKKSWWTKELEEKGIEYFKDWLLKEQLPELIKLNKIQNFEIISIDSSNKEYNNIALNPKYFEKVE
jgi:hypothetical protein